MILARVNASRSLKQAARSALLLFCLGLTGCEPPPEPALRIATNQWPGYEPLYLARNLGYLNNASVRLYELPNTTAVINAFRNHAIDIAALTLDEALLLQQDQIDVRILLIMDVSNGADALMVRPEMTSLSTLKGRRIAVENGAEGAYMLSRALNKANLTPADITVVPLTVDKHEEAFLNGGVDAVVTFEPVRSQLLKAGAQVVFDSSQIPNEIFDVLIVRGDTYRARANDMRELARAWFRALDYLKAQPQDAARRMADRMELSEGEFLEALKGLQLPDREKNLQLLSGDTPKILQPARALARVMLQEKLIEVPVDPAGLISSTSAGVLQ